MKEEYESKKLSSSRLEDVLEQLDREKNRIETYKVQQREFHHQLMDSKNENELLKLAVLDIKEKYVFLEKENKVFYFILNKFYILFCIKILDFEL